MRRRTREVLVEQAQAFVNRRERRASRRAVQRTQELDRTEQRVNGFRCRFGGPVEDSAVPADRAGVLVPAFDMLADHRATKPHEPLVQPDLEIGERLGAPSFGPFADEGREGLERFGGLASFPEKGRERLQRLGGLWRENRKIHGQAGRKLRG